MPVLFLTLLFQSFLPLFNSGSSDYAGLSFVNSTDSAAVVRVSATDGLTGSTAVGQVVLAAGEQRALLLEEILKGGDRPTAGWIRVDSGAAAVDVVLAHGNTERLVIAKPAAPTTALLIPDVRVDTGFRELGHIDTVITIARPGGLFPAPVLLDLVGIDGVRVGGVSVTLGASRSRTFRVSDTFRDVLPDNGAGGKSFEGYLRLSTGAGIVAWQMVETPLFAHVLDAQSVSETAGIVLAPFFVFGGGYRSTLNLVNPTDEEITVELVARDRSGGAIGEVVQRTLGRGEGFRSDVQTLFKVAVIAVFPPPLIDGYIRIRDVGNQLNSLVGNVEVGSVGQGTFTQSAMSYALGPPSATPWVVPFALGGNRYYTGLAIVNPSENSDAGAEATVESVQADGTVVNVQEISLLPGAQYAQVLPEELQSGYLRIRSNVPIGIVVALGTRDSRVLEQVPALQR